MEEERPTPQLQDTEGTRRKLESWLSTQRGFTVRIPKLTIPESTGMSNVTLLFDIEWQIGKETRREACVGRLQPEVAEPIFPTYDLSLQYEVMASVGRNSDIPVPELRGLELDASVLGNPVQDLAWFNHIDATFAQGLELPRLAGLPTYEATISQWEQTSGFSARDYDYYRIFAGMRFGLILSRIMRSAGQDQEVQGNFACQLLQKQLDQLT